MEKASSELNINASNFQIYIGDTLDIACNLEDIGDLKLTVLHMEKYLEYLKLSDYIYKDMSINMLDDLIELGDICNQLKIQLMLKKLNGVRDEIK